MPEMITLPKEQLQAIFDLAVNSMDFGSGFWGDDEVRAGRAIAVVLGVNPMAATPSTYSKRMAHVFEPAKHHTAWCHYCNETEDKSQHTITVVAEVAR